VYADALSVPAPVRVAIVEDDDAIRVLIEDLLDGEGYVCLAGNSLETGLELLERQRPDLLILDIVLGGVASGWMLVDQIGRNRYTAAIPVIVCTADATALLTHEAVLRERRIRCLAKPFDVQDLLHLVAEATTSKRPGGGRHVWLNDALATLST